MILKIATRHRGQTRNRCDEAKEKLTLTSAEKMFYATEVLCIKCIEEISGKKACSSTICLK